MKNLNKMPSEAYLKRIFRLWRSRGELFWKEKSKGVVLGRRAGYLNDRGYRIIMINKTNYRASRIIWTMVTGKDPGQNQIDHKNLNKDDNRFCNLRLSNNSTNHANTGIRADNKSGFKGVFFVKEMRKYEARCKGKVLGYFETAQEASGVYMEEAKRMFGEFARLN